MTTRTAPPGCAAQVIGRSLLRERGALALRRTGSGFVMDFARRRISIGHGPAAFAGRWTIQLRLGRRVTRTTARRDTAPGRYRSGSVKSGRSS